ncbi:MAG: FMN-binding protein [Acidobacteria bacterium]|nr:FMN-binding protein [Acidobacteriota bacterium]
MAVLRGTTRRTEKGEGQRIKRRAARRFLLCLFFAAPVAAAPVYETRDQALARAFPSPATIERRTLSLTPEQRKRASREARAKVESSLVVAYAGRSASGLLGTAYFDTHPVRTASETLLVTVTPDGAAGEVEVVAFGEPEDYLPRPSWLRLFSKKPLDDELSVGRGLAHVSGATLTTRAIAAAVRRVLAVHHVLSAAP